MALYTLALLALAAADGGASDAGLGWNDPLYAQCPQAPPPVPLEDGSWKLPPARAARNACLAETCEARRRTLEPIAAAPPPFSSGSLIADLMLLGLGVLAGVILGFTFRGGFK